MSIVKLNNRGVRSATTFGSITGLGSMVFLSKQTASSSSTISFTSGIDSTYKEYMFTFNNIHPATSDAYLTFQADTGTNTSYNQTVTSSFFFAQQGESNDPTVAYATTRDLAQSKHFISKSVEMMSDPGVYGSYAAGYFNTTTALTRVQFKMSSGNIDAGDICLYGIK